MTEHLEMRRQLSASSGSSSEKPPLSRGLSSLIRGKRSVLGELLRGSAPPWVEHLRDIQLTLEDEKRRKAEAGECALCTTPLKSAKDLEFANKKCCRTCGAVTCRQCAAHVHVLGHLRRRYVCFRCVAQAALDTKLVVVPDKAPAARIGAVEAKPVSLSTGVVVSAKELEEEEDSLMTTFVTKLWDTWSGWGRGGKEPGTDEEEEEASQEDVPLTKVVNLAQKTSEYSEEEKLVKMNELLAGAEGNFDGDALKSLLDLSHGYKGDGKLIVAVPFTKACLEVIKLLAGLGKAFEFAGSDMNDKLRTISKRTQETANECKISPNDVTLQMMVEREIKAKTTHAGKKAAGATRTIIRLLWFLDFIGVLMSKLANEPNTDLKNILSATYEETLSPRHIWMLRKIVRAGMSLVPEKKHFIPKLGLEGLSVAEQSVKLSSWGKAVDVVRFDMWTFMKTNNLEDVP